MLKAPGIQRLNLNYDKKLSSFALKFDLRHYIEDATPAKFNGVAGTALSLVTVIYGGVAIAAVALFGDETHADVLVDFKKNTALDQLVIKGMD